MSNEIKNLIEMSHYLGQRFDLIQIKGGNTSVKLDPETMLIKASGVGLCEMTENFGISTVKTQVCIDILKDSSLDSLPRNERDQKIKELGSKMYEGEARPSMESFMHAILGKYTLHTHPIAVNALMIQPGGIQKIKESFPDALIIDYKTPGHDLGKEIYQKMKLKEDVPKIIFLKNHGLITSHDSAEDAMQLCETVCNKLERLCRLNLGRYRKTTKLMKLFSDMEIKENNFFICEDVHILNVFRNEKKLFMTRAFCPDTAVFCGPSPLCLESLEEHEIKKYIEQFHIPPKVLGIEDHVYFQAQNYKKAREIEEMLKFHFLCLPSNEQDIELLSKEEIQFLNNWEAEKYRKQL